MSRLIDRLRAVGDLSRGLALAKSDDNRIGPNDLPGLQPLIEGAGLPQLGAYLERQAAQYTPPARTVSSDRVFAAEVVEMRLGEGAGFNRNQPDVVLGAPRGAGAAAGSLDVLSLGMEGSVTVRLSQPVTGGIKVFGNGFGPNGVAHNPDLMQVDVSTDGEHWIPLQGGPVGATPVYSHPDNGIAPESAEGGGDLRRFSDSGIPAGTAIQFVRLTDVSKVTGQGGTSGADLDAVMGLNG